MNKALMGFSGVSPGKECNCNAEDLDLIPGLEKSPGEGKGYTQPREFHGSQRVRHN